MTAIKTQVPSPGDFERSRDVSSICALYWPNFGGSVRQGWYGDDHLILFDDLEVSAASNSYAISQVLPGFKVIGLRGWDDFILQDPEKATFSVPTVPAVPMYVEPYALPPSGSTLEPEDRFHGKIKWYVKPIVFGGDPRSQENIIWVSHDQHAELVKYWNGIYRSIKGQ